MAHNGAFVRRTFASCGGGVGCRRAPRRVLRSVSKILRPAVPRGGPAPRCSEAVDRPHRSPVPPALSTTDETGSSRVKSQAVNRFQNSPAAGSTELSAYRQTSRRQRTPGRIASALVFWGCGGGARAPGARAAPHWPRWPSAPQRPRTPQPVRPRCRTRQQEQPGSQPAPPMGRRRSARAARLPAHSPGDGRWVIGDQGSGDRRTDERIRPAGLLLLLRGV
jgi:hypothetical protein